MQARRGETRRGNVGKSVRSVKTSLQNINAKRKGKGKETHASTSFFGFWFLVFCRSVGRSVKVVGHLPRRVVEHVLVQEGATSARSRPHDSYSSCCFWSSWRASLRAKGRKQKDSISSSRIYISIYLSILSISVSLLQDPVLAFGVERSTFDKRTRNWSFLLFSFLLFSSIARRDVYCPSFSIAFPSESLSFLLSFFLS